MATGSNPFESRRQVSRLRRSFHLHAGEVLRLITSEVVIAAEIHPQLIKIGFCCCHCRLFSTIENAYNDSCRQLFGS